MTSRPYRHADRVIAARQRYVSQVQTILFHGRWNIITGIHGCKPAVILIEH
jgi:hypothetical protein